VATRWYRAPELCGSFYSKVRVVVIGQKLERLTCIHIHDANLIGSIPLGTGSGK
jgi:hypothetical protein